MLSATEHAMLSVRERDRRHADASSDAGARRSARASTLLGGDRRADVADRGDQHDRLQRLDNDGIYARNFGRLWGILTAPFLHASFQHLIDNTIPFVFMGLIIALRGRRPAGARDRDRDRASAGSARG